MKMENINDFKVECKNRSDKKDFINFKRKAVIHFERRVRVLKREVIKYVAAIFEIEEIQWQNLVTSISNFV